MGRMGRGHSLAAGTGETEELVGWVQLPLPQIHLLPIGVSEGFFFFPLFISFFFPFKYTMSKVSLVLSGFFFCAIMKRITDFSLKCPPNHPGAPFWYEYFFLVPFFFSSFFWSRSRLSFDSVFSVY